MNTVVLHKKNGNYVECHSLCFESDVKNIKIDPLVTLSQCEVMSETLFKILHPFCYNKYVSSSLMTCLNVWIEQLYASSVDFSIDDDCLFTKYYFIQTYSERIRITFYIGCTAIESAQLILFLTDKLRSTEISIEISHTTVFASISQN